MCTPGCPALGLGVISFPKLPRQAPVAPALEQLLHGACGVLVAPQPHPGAGASLAVAKAFQKGRAHRPPEGGLASSNQSPPAPSPPWGSYRGVYKDGVPSFLTTDLPAHHGPQGQAQPQPRAVPSAAGSGRRGSGRRGSMKAWEGCDVYKDGVRGKGMIGPRGMIGEVWQCAPVVSRADVTDHRIVPRFVSTSPS
jgi:hypothetical protein